MTSNCWFAFGKKDDDKKTAVTETVNVHKKNHHKPESKKNVSILCNTVRKEKKHRAID